MKDEGARDAMTLIASGGIRTAHDLAKAICLGADGAVIGTAELVSLECVDAATANQAADVLVVSQLRIRI